MSHYRFYRLNAGQVVSRKLIFCEKDRDAISEALRLAQTDAIEVWRGERLLACVVGATRHRTFVPTQVHRR